MNEMPNDHAYEPRAVPGNHAVLKPAVLKSPVNDIDICKCAQASAQAP